MHLHRGPVGHLARPHVQVLALARLEEEHVVAVVQLRELVELIQLRLGVELGVLPAMGHHRREVVEEVSVSRKMGKQSRSAVFCSWGRYEDSITSNRHAHSPVSYAS